MLSSASEHPNVVLSMFCLFARIASCEFFTLAGQMYISLVENTEGKLQAVARAASGQAELLPPSVSWSGS